jgi:hypothetical protein
VADLPGDVLNSVSSKVAANSRILNVAVSPAGAGTVELPNSGVYLSGTVLRLTAVASNGYEFENWSTGDTDNPLELELNEPVTSVTANFRAASNYTAPNSFSAQGSIAFNESGGIQTMAMTERYKIRVVSSTGNSFDFVQVQLKGDNTYKVSNLPLGEPCMIEVVCNGRARLRTLVWSFTDGETKIANLTPASSVVANLVLAGLNINGFDELEEMRRDIENYYADPSHTAELNGIIDILNRGDDITQEDIPADLLLPFLREAPEISDLANWEYDQSWDINGGFIEDYPQPADLNAGGLFTGVQLGKKDGKLYFILKLNGTPNPNLRYQLMVGTLSDGDKFHITIKQNSESNWELSCHMNGPGVDIGSLNVFLDVKDDMIIAGGIPLTMLAEHIGTAQRYTSSAGVAFTGMNYYGTNSWLVAF